MKNKVVTVITTVTGIRVTVCKLELAHALAHFPLLPERLFLEVLENVLKEPEVIYADNSKAPKLYHLFYRMENGRYLLAVVKLTHAGNFFTTMFIVGKNIKNKHKGLKRIKL
jgi:hypothetical protein